MDIERLFQKTNATNNLIFEFRNFARNHDRRTLRKSIPRRFFSLRISFFHEFAWVVSCFYGHPMYEKNIYEREMRHVNRR